MSVQDEGRRETLKILGAIGSTCTFPFSANELYGQQVPVTPPKEVHQHPGPPQRPAAVAGKVKPGYFSEGDFELITRISDLIIPATSTPGAVDAGVPAYIDSVVGGNKQLQAIFRTGLGLLSGFMTASSEQQVKTLTNWSNTVDKGNAKDPGAEFFQAIKSLTADGYYTSYTGLVEELQYQGNTVLDHFPESAIPEH